MKQSIVKFLEFQGKNLLFLSKNGTTWVALKPVCEVLGVDYVRQFKNVSDDAILGPALSNQTMQVPGSQTRNYACLPEHLVYGWIFSIQSKSTELISYKKECYEILFNHFHGTIASRRELLSQKALAEMERSQLEAQLRMSHSFSKWESLKATEARIGKQLKEADRNEINEQMQLFD